MTIEQLRPAQDAEPFQPYTLRLVSGRSVRVLSPEFVAVSKDGRTISVATSDNAFEIIDLLLVESIQTSNGHRSIRRRRRR